MRRRTVRWAFGAVDVHVSVRGPSAHSHGDQQMHCRWTSTVGSRDFRRSGVGPTTPNHFDFAAPVERRSIDEASVKWGRYRRPYLQSPSDPDAPAASLQDEVLPMWVADMDFRSPPTVLQALQDRVAHGLFGYTAPSERLNCTVANYLARRHAWEVEPGSIVWLNGLVPALNLFCRMAGEEGDGVLVPTPVYPPFVRTPWPNLAAPINADRALLPVPLLMPAADAPRKGQEVNSTPSSFDSWRLDWPALESAVREFNASNVDSGPSNGLRGQRRVCALLLCSPHNPTGHTFSEEELRRLGEFCERHDILLCSDEIHADLLLEPDAEHIPAARVSQSLAERTVTLYAASKTFNIPSLCAAFAVIPDGKLRMQFKKQLRGLITEVPCLGLTATEAAFKTGEPWRQALVEQLRSNRDLLYRTIRTSPVLQGRIRVYSGQGRDGTQAATYLAWLDCSGIYGKGNAKPGQVEQLFRSHYIGLSEGSYFGVSQEHEGGRNGASTEVVDHMRLNFGCPGWRLEEGLRRIEAAVASVPRPSES